MNLLTVDHDKCIKCGMCAAVCPRGIITMGPEWPETVEEEFCIACGHCISVCPYAALDNNRAPFAGQIALPIFPVVDQATAHQFLRSRRSVRCYKKTPVSREKLLQLMDIARFAPTGGNAQGLSYVIIDNPETLLKITALTIDWMEEHVKSGANWAQGYAGYVAMYRKTGRDVILRDAPCLVIATAPKAFSRGRDNTHFSLAYVELYATTLGFGTCWAGLFEMCALSGFSPLLDLLNLSADKNVTGAVMVGYPEYNFWRLVDRNPLAITFAR